MRIFFKVYIGWGYDVFKAKIKDTAQTIVYAHFVLILIKIELLVNVYVYKSVLGMLMISYKLRTKDNQPLELMFCAFFVALQLNTFHF